MPIQDKPAFPRPQSIEDLGDGFINQYDNQEGMTMRQWYKGQIVKSILRTQFYAVADASEVSKVTTILVNMCGVIADAMIKEDIKHASKKL